MKKITCFYGVVIFLCFSFPAFGQQIAINEILASNSHTNTDEDGDYEDWIELYNPGPESVSLNGYGLSDNAAMPFKWVFPDYTIAAGEHLLVWCSDKNRTNPTLPLHTNFKISATGEILTLTTDLGVVANQIPAIPMVSDVSYGRLPSGGDIFMAFSVPTPGMANTGNEIPAPPVFSVDSGFFTTDFTLSITHPDPEATILYTLDGSEPKAENLGGKAYQYKNQYPEMPADISGPLLDMAYTTLSYLNPIEITDRSALPNKLANISTTFHSNPVYFPAQPVFKGTVVRAKTVKNGIESQTVTKNYFVTPQGPDRFSVPVVAISLDEDAFFDYEDGIHVAGKDFDDWRIANPLGDTFYAAANYTRSDDSAEVKANFSFYDSGAEVINQDVGLRMNGGYSRIFPNKSLRLYARPEYGNGSFEYPFFESTTESTFKRLVLRNAGNDAVLTYFRDEFIQRSVAHLNVATQAYQPAVAFVNGEYWGLLNLRERYDKYYFESAFGIDPGDLDFLEYNGIIVQEGSADHYLAMWNYLENNSLANDAHYDYIATQLDPENFIDHFIVNIYAGNTDWPHNNMEFWRKRTDAYDPETPYGQDGRWRWIIKDTDFGFGYSNTYQHNTLSFASSTGGDPVLNPEWSTFLFRKLLENNRFRNHFISRFADLVNTAFIPERLGSIISEMKTRIESEIPEHGQRWGGIPSLAAWNDNIDVMANFANERPFYQREHIREKFGLSGNINVTLDVDGPPGGYIKINTVRINPSTPGVSENPYPWTGVYFQNVPISLIAIPAEGYVFSHWSGASNSTEYEITIDATTDISITAHFQPVGETLHEPLYFWMIDAAIPNSTPLVSVNSSFEVANDGQLVFESALEGYPFGASHPNWGKASMERMTNPTSINYVPLANNWISFADSGMKGLKIKQPFQNNGRENTMIFSLPTTGFTNIIMAFACKNENAAEALLIDYSIAEGEPQWTTAGLPQTTLPLYDFFTLYEAYFYLIPEVDDNPNFKVRLRFSGNDMTADEGHQVVFNNISLTGIALELGHGEIAPHDFVVYPNPFTDRIYFANLEAQTTYTIFGVDGKRIKSGLAGPDGIDGSDIPKGMYLVELISENKTQTKKLVKQ